MLLVDEVGRDQSVGLNARFHLLEVAIATAATQTVESAGQRRVLTLRISQSDDGCYLGHGRRRANRPASAGWLRLLFRRFIHLFNKKSVKSFKWK
jgi:hypothetical protein